MIPRDDSTNGKPQLLATCQNMNFFFLRKIRTHTTHPQVGLELETSHTVECLHMNVH